MPGPDRHDALSGLLADLAALAEGRRRVPLGEVLATIGPRGFGPVLVVLALILILPLGMIPGMPGFVAILVAAIAVELALGRHALRPPRRLREVALPAAGLAGLAQRLAPLARWASKVLRPRLALLATSRFGTLLLALVLAASAAVIFVLGFIPGLPFALAWPLLLIGLGLAVRDGLALLLGYALHLPAAALLLRLLLPGTGAGA